MAISILAHGWALTLLFHRPVRELGSVDVATNAISVNLETTDIVDAMESAATKEAASSPAGAALKAARETREQAKEAANSERPAEAAEPKAEQMAKPAAQADAERQRVEDEAETIKRIKEAAPRDETKRRAEARKPTDAEEIEKTKREKARQNAAMGGIGATGASEAPQSDGRVSASQGSILTYGASLRALISTHTPRNIRKAAIRLAFSIAPAGGLSTVSVLTTSGKQEVDKRMVELVRTLSPKFPPPPAGASESQLTFNIEVVFR